MIQKVESVRTTAATAIPKVNPIQGLIGCGSFACQKSLACPHIDEAFADHAAFRASKLA
jgi:hypothetical protein